MTMWFNSGAGHDVWVEAVSNMWRETLGIEELSSSNSRSRSTCR